jgi:hypothetical protein
MVDFQTMTARGSAFGLNHLWRSQGGLLTISINIPSIDCGLEMHKQ